MIIIMIRPLPRLPHHLHRLPSRPRPSILVPIAVFSLALVVVMTVLGIVHDAA